MSAKVEKWKTVKCPEEIINQLSNAFPTAATVIDGSVKSIVIFPSEFPRGLYLSASWDHISFKVREPIRTETRWIVEYDLLGDKIVRTFADEEAADDYKYEISRSFLSPPEISVREETIDIYGD